MTRISFTPALDEGNKALDVSPGTYKAVIQGVDAMSSNMYELNPYVVVTLSVQPSGEAVKDKFRLWDDKNTTKLNSQRKLISLYEALGETPPDFSKPRPMEIDLSFAQGQKVMVVLGLFKGWPTVTRYEALDSVEKKAAALDPTLNDAIPF